MVLEDKKNEEIKIDIVDTIDVSKLHVGMAVKNYKSMCALLGDQPKTGDAKTSQMKLWKRYFDWEKVKHKNTLVVTEIYDIPLPEDIREDSVFSKYIEKQLTLALAQKSDGIFCFTDGTIYKALNMVGSEYDLLKSYESTVHELEKVDNEVSWYCMWLLRSQAKAKLRRILDNALESMKKRSLITYRREDAIIRAKGEDPVSATDEESEFILEAQQAALKELKYEIIPAVINSKDGSRFYRHVNLYLQEKYGLYGTFPWIKVIYKRPYYMDEIVEKVKAQYAKMATEYYDSRRQLNESVVESFYKMVRKSNRRAVKLLNEIGDDGWPKRHIEEGSNDDIKSSAQYLFDSEVFIEKYIRSDDDGKNGNDWVFGLNVDDF